MHFAKQTEPGRLLRLILAFRRTRFSITDSGEVIYYKRLFNTLYVTRRAQIKWPGQKEPTP